MATWLEEMLAAGRIAPCFSCGLLDSFFDFANSLVMEADEQHIVIGSFIATHVVSRNHIRYYAEGFRRRDRQRTLCLP